MHGTSEIAYEISPKDKLFRLNFSEVWQYRDLLFLFVRRDFVSVYKQTILGPLWVVIQPILTMLMFMVVFGGIAKISTNGVPQALFYLAGIVTWNFFATSLQTISDTFIMNAGIFGKVYFPRIITPLSIVMSKLISFGIQFILFMIVFFYYYFSGTGIHPNAALLLVPFLIIMTAGLGLGLGLIITSLTTKYRDLRFLITFAVQLAMYASPVIYPLSTIPDKYKIAILANPMSSIIETFKYAFLGTGVFNWGYLAYSFVFMMVVLITGALIFNSVEKKFMDTV
jgi:lipopolysaccharide transport system permease protein